jgi:hypothetical protein
MAVAVEKHFVVNRADDHPQFFHLELYDTNSSATNSVESDSGGLKHTCSPGDLLGGFGLFVQGLLAFLAFTCLIGT